MKKMILTFAMLATAGLMLTACGSSGKGGYSSPEKAAEAYFEACCAHDAEEMMRFMPAENREYWENEYHVTSSQMQEALETYLKEKAEKLEKYAGGHYKSVSVTGKEKNSISYMQELNEGLDNCGIKSEESYKVNCTTVWEADGETKEIDTAYINVYEYDGKWYSVIADEYVKKALG